MIFTKNKMLSHMTKYSIYNILAGRNVRVTGYCGNWKCTSLAQDVRDLAFPRWRYLYLKAKVGMTVWPAVSH